MGSHRHMVACWLLTAAAALAAGVLAADGPPDKKALPPAPAPALRPAPDAKLCEQARAAAREIFKDEYARTTPADRQAFARKLLDEAEKTKQDAAAKYVLYEQSVHMATLAGDAVLTLQCVQEFGREFRINVLEEKNKALAKVALHAVQPAALTVVGEAALAAGEEAQAAEQYELAERFFARAESVGRTTRQPALQERASQELKQTQELLREAGAIREALNKLQTDPNDPAACFAVGRYHCLVRRDWVKGLPLLAKGADTRLSQIAAKELAEPGTAVERLTLADLWWEWGGAQSGSAKLGAQERAAAHYEVALPELEGLAKCRVEQRLKAHAALAAGAMGAAVESGNVALAGKGAKFTGKPPSRDAVLIDGKVSSGYAESSWPCEWVLELAKVYRLCEVRLLLWDGDQRSYQYAIEVSADGKTWSPLVDRSKGKWRSWQTLSFSPRPVKALRIRGLHNTANAGFHAIELEAYCIPPAPIKPKFPSEP